MFRTDPTNITNSRIQPFKIRLITGILMVSLPEQMIALHRLIDPVQSPLWLLKTSYITQIEPLHSNSGVSIMPLHKFLPDSPPVCGIKMICDVQNRRPWNDQCGRTFGKRTVCFKEASAVSWGATELQAAKTLGTPVSKETIQLLIWDQETPQRKINAFIAFKEKGNFSLSSTYVLSLIPRTNLSPWT